MTADLFISYAWTSPEHREWVHLLASGLHQIGYSVLIDEAVDYGTSLSGFMREVTEARHILMVVDENYVERADTLPDSGVGIENSWIKDVYDGKPTNWLSVVFVRNPGLALPAWIAEHRPKGFNFNSHLEANDFPGAAQLDEVWRWIEDLPADKSHAVSIGELRRRAARIEQIDAARDPGNWASPGLTGRVTFRYADHPHGAYTVGHGDYSFGIRVSGAGAHNIYVYTDGGLKALGLITSATYERSTIDSFLRPGRTVTPQVGQSVVLMNSQGMLCVITIDEVQDEINGPEYIAPYVTFTYEVMSENGA
jgi:hypothetical protein